MENKERENVLVSFLIGGTQYLIPSHSLRRGDLLRLTVSEDLVHGQWL